MNLGCVYKRFIRRANLLHVLVPDIGKTRQRKSRLAELGQIGCSTRRKMFDWWSGPPPHERNSKPDFRSPMNSRSILATEGCRSISLSPFLVLRKSCIWPCHAFLQMWIREPFGETFGISMPRASPKRNPDAAQLGVI